jgi:DNA topoisomerase-2
MTLQNITFAPGLYKIFDEILVNAADNKVRDPTMDTVRVDIDVVRVVGTAPGWRGGVSTPVSAATARC